MPANQQTQILLEAVNISRSFDGKLVVRDLSLQLRKGQTLGLLGVNGAGKSTTLRMLAGALAPTTGRVLLASEDLAEQKSATYKRIGFLPENAPAYVELTVREFLNFCATLRGLNAQQRKTALQSAIERCDLGEVQKRLIGVLSKGFRQRVGLAQAILHQPDVILLDEPTAGLDPLQASRLRELIISLRQDHALVLSTHLLSDVSTICTDVAVMHAGRLQFSGALSAFAQSRSVIVQTSTAITASVLQKISGVKAVQALADGSWRVQISADEVASAIAQELHQQGIYLRALVPEGNNLEQRFLAIALGADVPEDQHA